jgi:NADH:ubiquinone oxidoreductase subunit 5 (subunit L)/multisubunit Na+/H+ antiporter MnhA subunit
MIWTAFVVAMLVLAGFVIIFYKLPAGLRRFLSKRYILTDILLCALAFWALSFTLIGIIAAAFISVIVSLYLLHFKKTASKRPIKDRPRPYSCKPHVHWAARCYNWLRGRA